MPYKNISDCEIETIGGKIKVEAGSTIYTVEEKNNFKQIKEKEFFRDELRKQVQCETRRHGGFTFLKIGSEKLKTIKPQTLGRLAYLSTYLDFGTQRLMAEPERTMKKNDLQHFLNISELHANLFCAECIEHGLLRIEDKCLYLDDVFFRNKSQTKDRIKIYTKTIRSLYSNMPSRYHRYFGYVIQLIPYINREWNIVCYNPDERNYEKIIPLTVKEICNLCNYSNNQSARFKNIILKCRFDWQGELASMCGLALTPSRDRLIDGLVINPHLVFHGMDFGKIEGMTIFFTPLDEYKIDELKNFKMPKINI